MTVDRAPGQIPPVDAKKQGFSMRMMMNNVGAIGHVTYPPFNVGGANIPAESLGLEYPIGQRVEHLFGGGVWIAGLLDTSAAGNIAPLRLTSTSYEGWGGGYEFYPGSTAADTIWVASRREAVEPPGWRQYWGSAVPYRPISDQDFYCTYTDTAVRVGQHFPLHLKVIQQSYAWNDPYADAIIIFEYRIINVGRRPIDSVYAGYFFEADVGPINRPEYWTRNFTAYIPESRTAYVHNPVDAGSTPVGAALLATTKSLDSLKYTFQWFPGPQTPPDDNAKYTMMSSGVIKPDEWPSLSDTRFVFSFGPFTLRSAANGDLADTVKIAVAVVSGYSNRVDHRIVLQRNAARALDIYLNQGIRLPATPPSPPLRVRVGFRRVELDWRWRPGDDELFGRPDPLLNWDTTNVVARRYHYRIINPPPGVNPDRGGRNFEAFRVWRSENPKGTDQSFVLIRQYDDPLDSFAYNTGIQYTLVDSNLVRGKTYIYSVTSLSIPNLAYQQIVVNESVRTVEVPVEPLESGKQVNAVTVELPFAVSNELGTVSVVPNPYRTDKNYTLESGGYEGPAGDWDENQRKIKFINLPEVCTIRIFSLAGDLVRTVRHDGRDPLGFSRGDESVLLLSDSNRAIASGIYIFTVESQYGTQTGKFVVIR